MFNGILFLRDKILSYSVLFAGVGLAVFKLQSMLVSGVSEKRLKTHFHFPVSLHVPFSQFLFELDHRGTIWDSHGRSRGDSRQRRSVS